MKKSARASKPAEPVASSVVRFPAAWALIGTLWAVGVVLYDLAQSPINGDYLGHILNTMMDFHLFHSYMLTVLYGFVIGAAIVVAAARGGARVLPEAGLATLERLTLGAALVLGVLAFVVMGLGAVRLWYPGVFAGVLVALLVWGFGAPLRGTAPAAVRPTPWIPVWKWLLGGLAVLYLIGAAAPEMFYDSLHYHLGIPNLFRLNHRIVAVPTVLYADFVMTIQFLYGLAITLGNTLSAKAVHVGMTALLGVGYVAFGRRFFNSNSGWLATLLIVSMPMVAVNATTAGTDVAGAFLLFASAAALIVALEQKTPALMRLAGLLTGIAASTKYPAFTLVPIACLLVLIHLAWDEKRSAREWLPLVAQFTAFAVLGVAPILVKNIVMHGNPVYPFGGIAIGHPRLDPVEWHKFVSDTSPRDLAGVFASLTSIGRWLAEPWFLVFSGQGTVGPLLLMGLPLAVRPAERSIAYRTLQRYALATWLVWLVTSTVPRYGLSAMVLIAPVVAEAVCVAAKGWMRWPLLGAFTLGALVNVALQLMLLFSWEGWQVVAGHVTENAFLGGMHATYPTPPYDALMWMNEHLPSDAVVLFAGESRSYYLNRRSLPTSIPGPQPVVLWAEQSHSGAELAQKMQTAGVTHIFVNLMEGLRTDSYHVFHWTPESWAVFNDFWARDTRLIWRQENPSRDNPQALYVFEVLPESEAAKPHPPMANPFDHWRPR